ncbi:ATP-binding protein [Indioceanicola profundi]|uniref:ATP-binding protein n=1 Tax=Indioceanicola profundi TaxID=2220096 RepID=UPI000E6ABEED|nr:ATP-binding protein [Indioceanicola profundi]
MKTGPIPPSLDAPDLSACAKEPIHIPGSIQPYGLLLAMEPASLTIMQASANAAAAVGKPDLLGSRLHDLLPLGSDRLAEDLRAVQEGSAHYLGPVTFASDSQSSTFYAVGYRSGPSLVLELEERKGRRTGSFEDVYPMVRAFVEELHEMRSVDALCELAAREVRRITEFDRVLVYRFDQHWNGTVVAEDRNDQLPSYLDLRFPASDIPAQARELYRLNRVRLIADANYEPVPIEPALSPLTGQPLDLSHSVLRSVSPVHLEYMRNMGTASSMSFSVLCEGRLWGLVSCHNKAPRRAPFHVRAACDHIAQIFALQVIAKERAADTEHRMGLRTVQVKLLGHMAEEDRFLNGLSRNPVELMRLTGADGAAIMFEDHVSLIGRTPTEAQVRAIAEWLDGRCDRELFATNSLPGEMPGAESMKDTASGVLAVSISQLKPDYLMWFRPEVVETVKWGGDPQKAAEVTPAGARLHPRKSFEIWKETVRQTSSPWTDGEKAAAEELRSAIVNVVLRKAEELASLTGELQRSNRELEAFSYSVSHDLRAPFRHIVGYAELLREREADRLSERGRHYLASVTEAAISAGTLVDNLLSFSQMGRIALSLTSVNMTQMAEEVRRRLEIDARGRDIEWRIGNLGMVQGDPNMLRLVFQNLLGNAIKFTRGRSNAIIELGCRRENTEVIFHVRDNGAGFDMTYVDKLFGVFQRLHHAEEFEGTGIGLANVRRIVERHGGRTWAEGAEGIGATFYFSLPVD